MAYTIIVEDDNSLYGSCKERIIQREKLFNKLWFLVAPYYKGYDMSQCIVTMRYLLPISREFKTETLVLSEERYEEYLKYTLPIDTNLTKEFGNIELNLTFTLLDVDNDGNIVQRVRKTTNHILKITQIPDWDSIIPDSALAALDQRIIKQSAQIKALNDMNNTLNDAKADNLIYEDNKLQLVANGKKIGDAVGIESCNDCLEDGIPVVDFSNSTDFVTPDDSVDSDNGSNLNDNVVEFDSTESNNNLNNVVEF